MPFEPGHPHYPPKDGSKLGPRTPGDRKAIRDLTRAVRDKVDPSALVEFHLAVAAGHNARLAIGESPKRGWNHVTWDASDREGVSMQAKAYAAKWLSERGWGLPVQQIQLDGEMRRVGADATKDTLPSGMSLAQLRKLREVLRPDQRDPDPDRALAPGADPGDPEPAPPAPAIIRTTSPDGTVAELVDLE